MLINIEKIAKKIGIREVFVEKYGNFKAKISPEIYKEISSNPDGKLVLVTAITPTKAGEGKTTTSISLLNGLAKIDQKAMLCLREPSLGPTFGMKGGATGGGRSTIEPSMDINLHFTGDMHALTSSINLISSIIDNHIYQGNELNIDSNKIVWQRALDINDRELRNIEIGLGSDKNGIKRADHFEITVASELMAILCLAKDADDFKERINKIIVAYTYDNKPVYLQDLHISNAIYLLMEHALKPNLVQSNENNPCFVHGGPFANIAHGCSSLIATKMALKLAPIVITEAGFAADLGAEKFFDIKCRAGGLKPDCVCLVATIRALKMHGGADISNIEEENLEALEIGSKNLLQHIYNLKKFNVPIVVSINKFNSDTKDEIKLLSNILEKNYIDYALCDGYLKGGNGSIKLASKVVEVLSTKKSYFKFIYNVEDSIKDKVLKLAKEIYRADDVIFTDEALRKIEEIKNLGRENLPICVAKTPLSFSDDPKLLNTPTHFKITVNDVKLMNGAGFIVIYCGNILTMPGLPKNPQATQF